MRPANLRGVAPPPVKWEEPPDLDPPLNGREPLELPATIAAKYLPDWARSNAPERIEGPFVSVCRITYSNDPLIVPTLHRALDNHKGGTIELADEGPFGCDDLRVSGDTRLIRARQGIRPIVRIERSNQDVVRRAARGVRARPQNPDPRRH